MEKKKIIVGATGASGLPLLIECLKFIRKEEGFSSVLLMTREAELTLQHETKMKVSDVAKLADETFEIDEIGAGPASGGRALFRVDSACRYGDPGGLDAGGLPHRAAHLLPGAPRVRGPQ